MFRFASSIASKIRLSKNSINHVDSGLSWGRNYVAKDLKFVSPCSQYEKVMAEAIFNEGRKILAAGGVNSKDLRRGIRMAIEAVSENLTSRARTISTNEEIAHVASTSANGDKEIGLLISQAIQEVGNQQGHIFVSEGTTPSSKLEFMKGINFRKGYLSSCFVTNKKNKLCVFNQGAFIFVYGKKLSDYDLVLDLLLASKHYQKPILIVAEDFEDDVVETITMEKLCGGTQVCAIKVPDTGEIGDTHTLMHRIAKASKTSVTMEWDYMNFHHPQEEDHYIPLVYRLGSCWKVIVSENDTTILERYYKEEIEKARSEEPLLLELSSPSEVRAPSEDKGWLYVVIKVGGSSRADVLEKKKIVYHALKAAKAAIEDGFVPGGGIALLNASKELQKLQSKNSGQKIGVQIIQNALKMPLYTIASSGGVEASTVVGKLLEQDNLDLGYDVAEGEYVDMIKYGIVDPVKLIKRVCVRVARKFLKKLGNDGLNEVVGGTRGYHDTKKWYMEVGAIREKAI